LFGSDRSVLASTTVTPVGAVFSEFDSPEARARLANVDVLITGWGTPELSEEALAAASRLRFVLHAGGQGARILPRSAAARGIQVSNAGSANGVPVAEFTTAMIVLANKRTFEARGLYRSRRAHIDREEEFGDSGNYQRTVGIVGASRIGRMVLDRLASMDLSVLLYDPYVTGDEAARLGARPVSLDELMAHSDVVSLHPPLVAETVHMIGRSELALLRKGTTIINTSRGLVIDQDALVDELRSGRINAILDVTDPEVLAPDHELYDLPNVFLTPHIAGSMGHEIRRMGEHIGAELARIAEGQPLAFAEHLA
jgi:phosphoglycerate dehydrogenase-like enzyme